MTCVFDQKNVSEIANKIVNKIAKKYNQIYDAVQKKGEEKGQAWLDEKMKLVDALAGAGVEKIMAAAGDLPPATETPDSGASSTKSDENKSDSSSSGGPTTDALPTIGPKPGGVQPINFNKPASAPASQQPAGTSTTSGAQQAGRTSTTQPSSIAPLQPEQPQSILSNPYVLYGGIGLVIVIVLIIIIMATSGGSAEDSESEE